MSKSTPKPIQAQFEFSKTGPKTKGRVFSWPATRFWAKVIQNGPTHPILGTACWDWTGSKNSFGYGHIQVNHRLVPAHRFSYELHYGPIPNGLFVCHHCDNPPCTNPLHLFLGNASDNSKDAADKGRLIPPHHVGSAHPQAKLTDRDVLEIRRRAGDGENPLDIARDFDVHFGTIYRVINRATWTHI
jgi:HNH endonuclease